MNEKSTSYHTIGRLLLRELRQERNVQQAQISQLLGRASTSSWSKVEAGDTPLTLDHLLTACTACQVWPSDFFKTVEKYADLMIQNGWYVAAHGSPLPKEEDQLGIEASAYYESIASKPQTPTWGRFPLLQTPWPYSGNCAPIDVFRWVLDPSWREQVSLPQNPGLNVLGIQEIRPI